MKPARRPMTRLTFLLCLMLLSIVLPGRGAGEPLTVGVPADRCPVFYLDPDSGEVVGIGVDLMRAAAQEAGYTPTFTVVSEETLKIALDNDAYDVVMPFGSAIPSASGQKTIVSDNLTQTPFTLVTESSGDLPPLNQLRVGMLRSLGGGAETVRTLFPGIRITLYETMDDSVRALRAGQVDALLHNSYVWSYVLQKPAYADLSVQPSTMFSMDFRAGTRDTPAGRAVIQRLNGGIATLTDTQRQAFVLDHTSRRLYQYDLPDYLYQYGPVLVLGGLLAAALVLIVVMRVRSYRLAKEREVQHLIDYDPLTGLLRLEGFRKRVAELLRAHPDIPYLLSYNNIKDFKFVNDSLGMAAGDDLLRFWAAKSREVLTDVEAIGRVGGDHFAVLRRIYDDEQMLADEKKVFEPLRSYFSDRGKEKRLQICTGVYVLTPEDYRSIDVDHMLDFARVAEKRVRESRRDGYGFYNPNQWERGKRIADLVAHLPLAIQCGEIQVWYQPQVNFDTGEITGTEALCRWDHAKLGWLPPSEFIPILEEAGLIFELDCFIWDRVCQDLHRWNLQGIHRSVSVNLSRRDIREDRNIPEHFFNLIRKYALSVDQLRIEITESAYVEDPELLLQTTIKLRELGFQVEMDDFGSGYSSLHMLKAVPVDRIKLDLHFLTGTGDAERGRIVVSYMIQMVHALGMKLIAEGVERLEQAQFLQSRGCSEMQGFYFYKPMSAQEFDALAERRQAAGKR